MQLFKKYCFIGMVFVLITGTLAHFTYQWSGKNMIAGLFFPVNESTWEHMKLLFFPFFVFSIILYKKFSSQYDGLLSALCFAILTGTFSIPVIFYTYTGILGFHLLSLDILTFFFSVLITFCTLYQQLQSCRLKSYRILLFFLTGAVFLCFIIFSYFPPNLGWFADFGKN